MTVDDLIDKLETLKLTFGKRICAYDVEIKLYGPIRESFIDLNFIKIDEENEKIRLF